MITMTIQVTSTLQSMNQLVFCNTFLILNLLILFSQSYKVSVWYLIPVWNYWTWTKIVLQNRFFWWIWIYDSSSHKNAKLNKVQPRIRVKKSSRPISACCSISNSKVWPVKPWDILLLFLKINIFLFMGNIKQNPLCYIASSVCLKCTFISFCSDIRRLDIYLECTWKFSDIR